MTSGERVRARRQARRISLRTLAVRATIGRSTLSRIERDVQEPRGDELERIAEALGYTMSEFYGEMPPASDSPAPVAG